MAGFTGGYPRSTIGTEFPRPSISVDEYPDAEYRQTMRMV